MTKEDIKKLKRYDPCIESHGMCEMCCATMEECIDGDYILLSDIQSPPISYGQLKQSYIEYIKKTKSELGNKYLTRLTDRNDKYYYNIIERGSLESLRKAWLEIEDKLREGNNE